MSAAPGQSHSCFEPGWATARCRAGVSRRNPRSHQAELNTDRFPSTSVSASNPRPPSLHILLLIVVAAVMFFTGLGRLPLLEPDEGRNAEVAREMLVGGDWVTPHYDGLAYLDKPAVFFWLVVGSFRVGGFSEFAARLPSALAALGTMLLVWFLARRMFGDIAGFRAGIIWATSPLVIFLSRLVIFDMTLAFLVTLAMAGFWLAVTADSPRWWHEVILFGACGVAAITKGPVGFLVPWLSILLYQAVRGRLRELKRLKWGLGVALFLAAALPWFVLVSLRNPDFPRYAFWQESLLRFTTGEARRSGGIFYYLPVYLGGFFPWSFFLLFGAWNWRKKWRVLRDDGNRSSLFLLSWAVVVFLFFTISRSKLPTYFLPAIIPLTILMAKLWSEGGAEGGARTPDWLTAGFAALMVMGLLIAAAAAEIFRFPAVKAALQDRIHPRVLPFITPSLIYSGLILLTVGILGRNLASRWSRRSIPAMSLALAALTAPLLIVRWLAPLRTYAETESSRRLAEIILKSPEKNYPIYGLYHFRTSLPFYLQRPVLLVTTDGDELTSNYTTMRYSEFRSAYFLSVQERGAQTHQAGRAYPPAFESTLYDVRDFQARVQPGTPPFLVLVRNDLAEDLVSIFKDRASVFPLWTMWEDSVWEVVPPVH